MGTKLKKLKRPSAGTPSAGSKRGASSNADASKPKKARGPKPYIALPASGGNNDGQDGDEEEDEEAARKAALDAEEMVAGGGGGDSSDDDGDDGDGDDDDGTRAAAASSSSFLLKLDQKGLSRSRAEEKRLQKSERKAEKNQAAQKAMAQRNADGNESDASTDMEGASEGSSSDDDDGNDDQFSGFDSEDFRSDLDSDDDDGDAASADPTPSISSDSDDDKAERKYQERLLARNKRQKAQDAQEAASAKRRKLPVRGDAGQWQDDSDDDDDDGGASTSAAAQRSNRAIHKVKASDALPSSDEDSEDDAAPAAHAEPASTITSGARFGMQAPYTIMTLQPRSSRVAAAREQIARLSTDIVGDPEVSLGLLRRLSVFAQRKIFRPDHDSMARSQNLPEAIEVDDAIRGAALMSLTAVYVDILPGYRIRALTDTEKQEKVNQETARRREWEQGLVEVYRQHLEICEKILRAKVSISSLALRSMSVLLTRAMHFNYRTNLIGALVSQLSRRSWSPDSQMCCDALVDVLRRDLAGDASLEVVRLLNRMIKERSFKINARVLNILLHLRLRNELGNKRADTVRADKPSLEETNGKKYKTGKGKAKPSDVRKGQGQHLSKKQIKLAREMKEVEKDMKEAEAEVDHEERERNQTETLKLLFVLYFSILKADAAPGPLLGAALEGLARFAHRVNVDFFRDLLVVLRNHVRDARAGAIARSKILPTDDGDGDDGNAADAFDEPHQDDSRKALLCLVTAFELLSGQGEALNIDLSDMVSHLYAILLPLCSASALEDVPEMTQTTQTARQTNSHLVRTDADLLLRALDLCLLRPRLSDLPSERSAAFIKRILICALYTPTTTTLRLLGVVRSMIGKDPKLEALLDTEDRAKNGKFDPAAQDEDVELARPLAAGEVAWELHVLARHVNIDIASTAQSILALQSA